MSLSRSELPMHRVRLVLALLFVGALLLAPAARSASSDMVVSQVYAGGGNSGATYTNDFVELFNRGSTAVDLGTWSIQYASMSRTDHDQASVTARSVPKTADGYIRVSRVAGREGDSFISPDIQRKKISAWAGVAPQPSWHSSSVATGVSSN